MINITSYHQVRDHVSRSCDTLNHAFTGIKAMYFNLSEIFSNHTITSAEMSSSNIVTAAVVSQKFKV